MEVHENVKFYCCRRKRALTLSLVGGAFGMHRFYLHQHWQGLAYLLFSWTLVPFVLASVDAFFLAQMSDEEFQEEYNDMPHKALPVSDWIHP